MTEKKKMSINEKLSAIQTELKVKKTSYNSFGKYYFRNSETILEALKPLLKKHECTVAITEQLEMIGETAVMCSTATLSDGKNEVFANSLVGIDFEQRGMNMPQKFGSASSYAKKYALGNLFLIDDTADSDATNTHGSTSKAITKIKAATKPTMTKDQFDKAKEYLAAGGDITAIESKYKINTQHLVDLKEVANA
jgi:hypothetical protein